MLFPALEASSGVFSGFGTRCTIDRAPQTLRGLLRESAQLLEAAGRGGRRPVGSVSAISRTLRTLMLRTSRSCTRSRRSSSYPAAARKRLETTWRSRRGSKEFGLTLIAERIHVSTDAPASGAARGVAVREGVGPPARPCRRDAAVPLALAQGAHAP